MIVTVFEDDKEPRLELLQQSDLAIKRTGDETVAGEVVYKITKSRYGEYQDKLLLEKEIRQFVQEYEKLEEQRKENTRNGGNGNLEPDQLSDVFNPGEETVNS